MYLCNRCGHDYVQRLVFCFVKLVVGVRRYITSTGCSGISSHVNAFKHTAAEETKNLQPGVIQTAHCVYTLGNQVRCGCSKVRCGYCWFKGNSKAVHTAEGDMNAVNTERTDMTAYSCRKQRHALPTGL
jgi:hypothetical protein